MLSETQSNFADDVKNRRHEISTKKTREEKRRRVLLMIWTNAKLMVSEKVLDHYIIG